MEGKIVDIKIKHLSDKVYDINISVEATVLELKNLISEITGVPASDQKIIFKGILIFFTIILTSNRKDAQGF